MLYSPVVTVPTRVTVLLPVLNQVRHPNGTMSTGKETVTSVNTIDSDE